MPRGVSVCQQCGSSMSTHTFVCPNCGTRRERKGTHPHGPIGQGFEVARHGPYKKRGGDWTISLVNGKQQIAATVSEAVAKRIIGMLF